MFEMKKKKNESKRKQIPEFFHKQEKKDHSTIYLKIKLAGRESFLTKVKFF